MPNLPRLTSRLATIAALVPYGARLADVGTDHAYLPVYLAARGIIPFGIAADVNEGPLKRAGATIAKYNVEDKVKTRLSNGFDALAPGEVDCVVAAGMGGLLIASIMEGSPEFVKTVSTFILQPMTAGRELRDWLCANGFAITNEHVAREKNRMYYIIGCRKEDVT